MRYETHCFQIHSFWKTNIHSNSSLTYVSHCSCVSADGFDDSIYFKKIASCTVI